MARLKAAFAGEYMEVSCPECSSRFNLPDKFAKPGAKLRCAVCKNVFQLPGEVKRQPPPPPPPSTVMEKGAAEPLPQLPAKKKHGKLWLAASVLLAVAAGVASWFFYSGDSAPKPTEEELSKNVEQLTMRNVRQYTLPNEKVGKVFVIEGRVVNEFPEPKELIELEAAIYDKNRQPVKVKRQLAGAQLSLFQLQVLSEKEMESFLNNKMEILANNTNVPPGGEVPFMMLFYAPPDDLSEFGVKITDAKNVGASLQ